MTPSDGKEDRLSELMRVLLDEDIGEPELSELSGLLRDDTSAMRSFLAYLSLDVELAWECGRVSLPAIKPDVVRAGAVSRRSWLAWGGLSALAAVTAVIMLAGHQEPSAASSSLTLEQFSGVVSVTDSRGRLARLNPGMRFTASITVTTTDPMSFTTLVYGDGTRVLVAGDSQATFSVGGRKTVETTAGTISAAVTPQPAGSPMLLMTPRARLEVLGTEFSVVAGADRTDLHVTRGAVRFTRVADGQSVEVVEGKQVEADISLSTLTVHDAKPASGTWGEDFEAGLPRSWLSGTFTGQRLPIGSRGAVKAQFDEALQVYGVATPHPWVEGLFVVQADTHLHVTYRMEQPEWVNLFFITRTSDPGVPRTFLHKFSELPAAGAGRWLTVTIPLRSFQRKSELGFEDVPPEVGELVFGMSCNSPGPDRGLVIDRLWVTPDGPGRVVVEEIE